jgi:transcriptional regulator with XRE-family HTH domain
VLASCDFIGYSAYIMPKAHDSKRFNTVAEFMRASGLNDAELAKLLDIDRSEATRLRLGRTYRSLIKPLKIARVCSVPIESLAPFKAA